MATESHLWKMYEQVRERVMRNRNFPSLSNESICPICNQSGKVGDWCENDCGVLPDQNIKEG